MSLLSLRINTLACNTVNCDCPFFDFNKTEDCDYCGHSWVSHLEFSDENTYTKPCNLVDCSCSCYCYDPISSTCKQCQHVWHEHLGLSYFPPCCQPNCTCTLYAASELSELCRHCEHSPNDHLSEVLKQEMKKKLMSDLLTLSSSSSSSSIMHDTESRGRSISSKSNKSSLVLVSASPSPVHTPVHSPPTQSPRDTPLAGSTVDPPEEITESLALAKGFMEFCNSPQHNVIATKLNTETKKSLKQREKEKKKGEKKNKKEEKEGKEKDRAKLRPKSPTSTATSRVQLDPSGLPRGTSGGQFAYRGVPGKPVKSLVSRGRHIYCAIPSDGTLRVIDKSKPVSLEQAPCFHLNIDMLVADSLCKSYLLVITKSNSILLWSCKTNTVTHVAEGHTGWVSVARLLPSGVLITGSKDSSLRLWNIQRFISPNPSEQFVSSMPSCNCAICNGGTGAKPGHPSVGTETSTEMVNTQNPHAGALCIPTLATLHYHSDAVTCLHLDDSSGTMYSGSADKTINAYSLETMELKHTLTGHTNMIFDLVGVASAIYSCAWDFTVRCWDGQSGTCLQIINTPCCIGRLRLHRRHLICAPSTDADIILYSIKNMKEDMHLKGHTKKVNNIMVHMDFLYSASADGSVKQWSLKTGQCVKTFSSVTNSPVAFMTVGLCHLYITRVDGSISQCTVFSLPTTGEASQGGSKGAGEQAGSGTPRSPTGGRILAVGELQAALVIMGDMVDNMFTAGKRKHSSNMPRLEVVPLLTALLVFHKSAVLYKAMLFQILTKAVKVVKLLLEGLIKSQEIGPTIGVSTAEDSEFDTKSYCFCEGLEPLTFTEVKLLHFVVGSDCIPIISSLYPPEMDVAWAHEMVRRIEGASIPRASEEGATGFLTFVEEEQRKIVHQSGSTIAKRMVHKANSQPLPSINDKKKKDRDKDKDKAVQCDFLPGLDSVLQFLREEGALLVLNGAPAQRSRQVRMAMLDYFVSLVEHFRR